MSIESVTDDFNFNEPDYSLSQQEVRNRTQREIFNALTDEENVCIVSPPSAGKTKGAVKALTATDTPAIYLSPRTDLYEQFAEWCEEEGLTTQVLPSLPRNCETYPTSDEPSTVAEQRVYQFHQRGMPPRRIHDRAICPEGQSCEYEQAKPDVTHDDGMGYVPQDEADVLIGHPAHAYAPPYMKDRSVIFDDIEITTFIEKYHPDSQDLQAILSHDKFPIDTISQLTAAKGDDTANEIQKLNNIDIDTWDDDSTIRAAEKIVRAFISAEPLGNGLYHFQNIRPDEPYDAIIDENDKVYILNHPVNIELSNNSIILDGTPLCNQGTPFWYNFEFGREFKLIDIVDDEERREYYRDAMGLRVVQTTPYLRPGMGSETAKVTQTDRERIQKIVNRFGLPDATITSEKAKSHLEELRLNFGEMMNYANIRSSNDFSSNEVGLIWKSPHFGDSYIKRIAGLMGKGVTTNDKSGKEKAYSGVGQAIYEHMAHKTVEQAITRFGRDEDVQPTVIVETAAIPDYMPVEKHFIEQHTCKDAVLWYLNAVGDFRESTGEESIIRATDIYDAVEYSERHIREELNELESEGKIKKSVLPEPGGPTAWEIRDN